MGHFIKSTLQPLKEIKLLWVLKVSILQFLLVHIANGVLSELFYIILDLKNLPHINHTDFWEVLKNLLCLIILVIYMISVALFIHIEFYLLFAIIQNKPILTKTSLKQLPQYLKKFWQTIGGRQLPVFLAYILVTIPVLHVGLASVLTQKIAIPDFIIGELMKETKGQLLVYSLAILIAYINIRLMLVIPLVSLKHLTTWQSIKESWSLTRKNWSLLLRILCLSLLILFSFSLIVMALIVILSILDSSGNHFWLQSIFLTLMWEVTFLVTAFVTIGLALIFKHFLLGNPQTSRVNSQSHRKIAVELLLLVIITTAIGFFSVSRLAFYQTNVDKTVIAHRGVVARGVENSIEALEGAKTDKSDYVEMDLMLTKDRHFVVSHDNNLKRLAGIDQNISDMTLEEVKKVGIEQGDFSSHISSFKDYANRAKALNLKLLIELKPNPKEPSDYVDLFLKEYQELGLSKEHKVMSLNLKVMEDINKKQPTIETGHVIPIQFGIFGNEKVDFFVIEDLSYRPYLSLQAYWSKKKIYVWTINKSERIEHFLDKPIDGIITDNPLLVRNIESEMKEDKTIFDRVLRLLKEFN